MFKTHRAINNAEQLAEILLKVRPHYVFHLASLFLSQHRPDQINELIQSNINFPTVLLEAMRLAGVKSLINTGTSWQHYENSEYNPVNLYAATKQAFDTIIKYYVEAHQFNVCTLKLFDTYGPNDPRPKLISLLYKCAKEGVGIEMSPGEQIVDLVYIDDVVEAYCVAVEVLEKQVKGHKTYGVTSKRPMTLREIVQIFEEITKMPLNVVWGGRPYREREVMRLWDTFETLPFWAPKIPFEIGIEKSTKN